MQPVKIRSVNHLNHWHDFKGSVNRWPLMGCIQTESRRPDLPKSLAATNWPIFRISASFYIISIFVPFDAKNWLEFTAIKPLDLPLRMLKITFPKYKISKFPGGACPQTPLDTPASGEHLSLGEPVLSNALSLHFARSCVLEFLSVRRIFVVPKYWICKLIFFWETQKTKILSVSYSKG